MKTAGWLALAPVAKATASFAPARSGETKQIYEWRIYTLAKGNTSLDAFYRKTLIAAYNRLGITVGGFEPYKGAEQPAQRFFLFVYPDLNTWLNVKHALWQDEVFRAEAQPFYDASAPEPAYSGLETFLCEAFDGLPLLQTPPKERTLLEFRNYKSPNEEANRRKINMFNADEMAIFDQVGIRSVCYGEVLAGPRMPSLIYLTAYRDEVSRNEAWKRFAEHPEWQRIRALPEYAHTATDNRNLLLSPLSYSQL
jgi:hypothetical protein